ncbi:MAG: DUF5597 domain-containing protein, partial [Planctomycetota bacterium]|jgi:hypothetical protein
MVIRLDRGEFLLLGVGFTARFRRPRPDGGPLAFRSAEWGRYEGSQWRAAYPFPRSFPDWEGEGIYLVEPGVMRVELDLDAPA